MGTADFLLCVGYVALSSIGISADFHVGGINMECVCSNDKCSEMMAGSSFPYKMVITIFTFLASFEVAAFEAIEFTTVILEVLGTSYC